MKIRGTYKSVALVLGILGVATIAFTAFTFTFTSISEIGSEDNSIFVAVYDTHVEIDFSSKAEMFAYYDMTKKIPLDTITSASSDISLPDKASRIYGTGAKELRAGTFESERGTEYWFVKMKKYPILTIEIEDEKYERLVLELKDAREIASKINDKL